MDQAHSIESDDFPSNDDFYCGSEAIAACNEMDVDCNDDSEATAVDILQGVGSNASLSYSNHVLFIIVEWTMRRECFKEKRSPVCSKIQVVLIPYSVLRFP
jgi:hypothetical protein